MNRLTDWIKQPRPTAFFWVLSVFVAFFITSCTGAKTGNGYGYQVPSELGDGWETASLADAGLDSDKLAAMMADIQDGGFEISIAC